MLVFEPGVSTQQLNLTVFEDDEVEEDEDFYVDLLHATPPNVLLQRATVCHHNPQTLTCQVHVDAP